MRILAIIYFFSFATLYSCMQSKIDTSYKQVMPIIHIPQDCIKLVDDNYIFQGYMVFEINRLKEIKIQNSKNFYICKIFWIENLVDLSNRRKYFYYNIGWRFYEDELYFNETHDSTSNCSKFKNFYKLFVSKVKDSSYHFFLENMLYTKIFYDPNVIFFMNKELNNIGYFIFKNSFTGALLEYRSILSGLKKIDKSKKHKFLLPISQDYNLISITESEAKDNFLTKANWFPKLLLKD